MKSYAEIRGKRLFHRDEDRGAYTFQSEVALKCGQRLNLFD